MHGLRTIAALHAAKYDNAELLKRPQPSVFGAAGQPAFEGLTPLEREVLDLLIAESNSNGHDFGLLECVQWPDRKQLGGIYTSLKKKGYVAHDDVVHTNQGHPEAARYLQYVLDYAKCGVNHE